MTTIFSNKSVYFKYIKIKQRVKMKEIDVGTFYLTQFSTGSLILAIFSLTFALFFLIGKNRSKATKNMGIAFTLLSFFHLAYFTGFSIYHPYAAYHRWFTVICVMFTQIHIILFLVEYPDNRNKKLSHYIKIIMYIIAATMAVYYIFSTVNSPRIFRFDGHFWDIDNKTAGIVSGSAILMNSLLSVLIVIWRVIQLKKRERFWLLLVTIPFLIGMIIPAVLNILLRQGMVDRELFQTTLNASHLFGFFTMSLAHLNTTKDRFTFMGRIVGVTIVTFLAIFLIISRLYIRNIDHEYDNMRNHEMQLGLAGITGYPAYLYAIGIDNKKIELIYTADEKFVLPSMNITEVNDVSSFKNIKKISDIKGKTELFSRSGNRLYRENSKKFRFISYILKEQTTGIIYEAGFSYVKYRYYIHESVFQMVILILGVMLFMIIGYPWLYFGTLYIPLNALLKGVEEVKSGNLNFRLEVRSEDEIGLLTDRFNLMINRLVADREMITRSERKYRELTDLLPDIIYETDTDLNVSYLNKSGFILTGYTGEDLIAGLSMSSLLDGDELKQLQNFIREPYKSGNIFNRNQSVRRKNGKKFIGDNSAVIIYTDNRITGIRGIIRDITDRKTAEDALIQMQKMDTIGALVGGIAHDFNNILGGITGPLSLIKHSVKDDEDINKEELDLMLSTMENSSFRAIDMVKQLLSLAHKSPSIFMPVDLNASIQNVYKICSSTFEKSIELAMDIPEMPSMTEGDPTQIEQAILNICINASHAMTVMRNDNKSGGKLLTTLSMIRSDHAFRITHPAGTDNYYWNLKISDTGIGMEPETVSKIFIPFFTTKESGKGTGLGLSMVYSIIRNHRGFIDVYSSPGMGTIFNIYLPVLNSFELSVQESDADIPRGSGTILVIDDEEMIRRSAKLILEKSGYDVITASDGIEAVNILSDKNVQIDLVIVDLLMPVTSGDQILREITRIYPDNIKLLLASGLTEDQRINDAIRETGCGFIQKPYTMEKLSKVVFELLHK